MRNSCVRLTSVFFVTLALVGCSEAPPPAAPTTTADKTLPPGVTKTTKGTFKGKMTNEVRKSIGTVGLDE